VSELVLLGKRNGRSHGCVALFTRRQIGFVPHEYHLERCIADIAHEIHEKEHGWPVVVLEALIGHSGKYNMITVAPPMPT